MTIVNNPGTWDAVYGPLLHAPWHGWTPTDLVFPFFMFIVGVVVPIALAKQVERGASKGQITKKVLKRAAIIFGIGLFLAAYPIVQFQPEFGLREGVYKLRALGVLQRIALGYLGAALLYLYTSKRTMIIVSVLVLLWYWLAMTLVPVPGHGAGLIDSKEYNLAAYLDRMIIGENHLWAGAQRRWDPEGLFSTLPAIITSVIGVLAGYRFIEKKDLKEVTLEFAVYGFGLLCLGYWWDWSFPINKALWTSSYVLFTGGIALLGLASCIWLVDLKKLSFGKQFFTDFGVNALLVYAGTSLLAKTYMAMGTYGSLYEKVLGPILPAKFASFLSALSWVVLWYIVLQYLRKKEIRISV